jgi:hypothetical protein
MPNYEMKFSVSEAAHSECRERPNDRGGKEYNVGRLLIPEKEK